LVWKLKQDKEDLEFVITDENRLIADMALFSFVKINAKINKYTHIRDYRQN